MHSYVMHRATTLVRPWKKPDVEDDEKTNASHLFLLLGLGTLDLRRSPEGLLPVLALLACCREEEMSALASLVAREVPPGHPIGFHVRCCLLARSILVASPTRTNL